MLLLSHDFGGALERYRRAQQIYEEMAARTTDARVRGSLAASYENISEVLWQRGEMAAGFETYDRALQIREAIVAEQPESAGSQLSLASALDGLAMRLIYTDKAKAVSHMQRAIEINKSLVAVNPTDVKMRRNLAVAYVHMGDALWAAGDLAGEVENYRRGLVIYQELAAADPANTQLRHNLAATEGNMGYALAQTGDASGLNHCRKAVETLESLAAADPTNAKAQRDLAAYSKWFGDAYSFLASSDKSASGARI